MIGEFLRGPNADFTSEYTIYAGRDNSGHIIQTDSETPYTITRDRYEDYAPPPRWQYHFTVTKNDTTILTAEVIPSERLGPQLILHIESANTSSWESDLNRAEHKLQSVWNHLSAVQRRSLKAEELDWITEKDAAVTEDGKVQMINQRIAELEALQAP